MGFIVTGYINNIVSKHFYSGALEAPLPENETFYNVRNDKLGDLIRVGNLPIFTRYYTEYLDGTDNKINNELYNKFLIQTTYNGTG